MTGLEKRVERLEQVHDQEQPAALKDWTPTPEYAGRVFDILAEVLPVGELEALMQQRLADGDYYR